MNISYYTFVGEYSFLLLDARSSALQTPILFAYHHKHKAQYKAHTPNKHHFVYYIPRLKLYTSDADVQPQHRHHPSQKRILLAQRERVLLIKCIRPQTPCKFAYLLT